MPTIFDLADSRAIAVYIETVQANRIPLLGEALFPSKQKAGLTLEWLKGYENLPVALAPSAFDTKPNIRDRIKAERVITEMPFFREAMRMGEKERQQILQFLNDVNNPYARAFMNDYYDDAKNLVEGALVQPERMRWMLATNGTIDITAASDKGRDVSYSYDFDQQGKWRKSHTLELTGTQKWSDHENSDPVRDINNIKRTASSKFGVTITRATINSTVWDDLLANKKIARSIFPVVGAVGADSGFVQTPTDAELTAELRKRTGITITSYDKTYKDENLKTKKYYPDRTMTLFGEGTLGTTWFGTTPEQADLMSGVLSGATVSITNTGIAVCTKTESGPPVNLSTWVSEIVLPSFEAMESVFNIKY